MTEQLTREREFEAKCLLTREQMRAIAADLGVGEKDFIPQVNIYLDTVDSDFKRQKSALRIRRRRDFCVLTLKSRQSDHHLEQSLPLDERDYSDATKQLTVGGYWEIPEKLLSIFDGFEILSENDDTLKVMEIATIRTERAVVDTAGGQIMLDQSKFYGQTDYEIEVESHSDEQSTQILAGLLEKYHLKYRKSQPKIARALASKHNN